MTTISSILLFVFAALSGIINEPLNPYSKEIQKDIRKSLGLESPTLRTLTKRVNITSEQNFGDFFEVYEANKSNIVGFLYVGRAYTCRQETCSNNVANSEYFDYFILFNSKKMVELVKITAYRATRGHQMTSAGWLRQYKNYDGKKLLSVGKEIDAISGATVSVKAINNDIQRVAKHLLKISNLK